MAKNVRFFSISDLQTLENEGEHRNYNFLHFQVGEFDEREVLNFSL